MPDLSSLALLACPIGMVAMMWFMMRGKKTEQQAEQQSAQTGSPAQSPETDARVAQLQAELDQVKARLRDETIKPSPAE